MSYELESWVDTEAQNVLNGIILTLDDLLHDDGINSHQSASRGHETAGEEPPKLLAKQNIDLRAAREESDEWRDWKASFPHIRCVKEAEHGARLHEI
jgi:hypothetical protein